MIGKKNEIILLLFLLIGGVHGSQSRKQVCIIGAGMSGLVSANQLSKKNIKPIVFERGSDIGGQWRYTDKTDVDEHGLPVHSSVYKNMSKHKHAMSAQYNNACTKSDTFSFVQVACTELTLYNIACTESDSVQRRASVNGVKVLMTFPDYNAFHGENRSYVHRQFVLQYLRNYTEHFNLRRYIKLDTLVEKVSLMPNKRWLMKTRNLNLNRIEVHVCDAVMVCNGQFTKPNVPKIPGLETFPGRVLHSHTYRHPEEFANQTVVILGASYSGLDIAAEISNYAKKVYLSHRRKKLPTKLPKNTIQIPGVVSANGSDLILSNDSRVRADAFMMCTGYLYEYPFLDESSGITVTKGKYVHPLYRHLININNPTMAFVGVPHPGFPFLVPYVQANYFVSLLRGTAKLPSREVMLQESQLLPGIPETKAHDMKYTALLYYDILAIAAGVETLPFTTKKVAVINTLDLVRDPINFKNNELFVRDGHVVYIRKKKDRLDTLVGPTVTIFIWALTRFLA